MRSSRNHYNATYIDKNLAVKLPYKTVKCTPNFNFTISRNEVETFLPEFDSKISIVRETATESLPVLKL